MRSRFFTLTVCGLAWTTASWASPRYPVSAVPTLSCMSLKVTDQQAMDPSFVVPFYKGPSERTPVVGRASSVVLVKKPVVEKDGFIAAVLFNGVPGWVSAATLGPWHTMDGSSGRCIPSRMSDGSIGFDIK